MICDTLHLTPDTCTWGGVNILSKLQLPNSYGLAVKVFWRFFHKGSLSLLMNYHKAVCQIVHERGHTYPQTERRILVLIDWIGPVGWYSKNSQGPNKAQRFCYVILWQIVICNIWFFLLSRIEGLKKIERGGDRHKTDITYHKDIATYRLNWPRDRFSEKNHFTQEWVNWSWS